MGQHWDQAYCLKLCVCVCIFFSLSVCCLSSRSTISDLVASVPANASSGKAGWESLGIGPHSKLSLSKTMCSADSNTGA